jgi:hypothetical protein
MNNPSISSVVAKFYRECIAVSKGALSRFAHQNLRNLRQSVDHRLFVPLRVLRVLRGSTAFERCGSGGWSVVTYSLRIEAGDESQPVFEIVEETEDVGEDIVVSSADPDEAAAWIEEQAAGGGMTKVE